MCVCLLVRLRVHPAVPSSQRKACTIQADTHKPHLVAQLPSSSGVKGNRPTLSALLCGCHEGSSLEASTEPDHNPKPRLSECPMTGDPSKFSLWLSFKPALKGYPQPKPPRRSWLRAGALRPLLLPEHGPRCKAQPRVARATRASFAYFALSTKPLSSRWQFLPRQTYCLLQDASALGGLVVVFQLSSGGLSAHR